MAPQGAHVDPVHLKLWRRVIEASKPSNYTRMPSAAFGSAMSPSMRIVAQVGMRSWLAILVKHGGKNPKLTRF
jgi:hypothetical protein